VIYRGVGPDLDIPDVPLTEHVLGGARAHGDRTALVDAVTGERLSYRELADGVDAAAGALAALGVRPAGMVALVSHNQPGYPVALHAALAAGAAVTPANPVLTVGELTTQLRRSGATAVISSEQAAGKVAEAADAAGIGLRVVLGTHPGFRPFAELVGSGAAAPHPDLDPATAVAALPFSSGTTGLAKGVLLTHRNLVAAIEQNRAGWPLTERDVAAAALPFFHIYGLMIILNSSLRAGATVVTLPRYDLHAYLRLVQEHRVTRAFLAPPMVLGLAGAGAAETAAYDLSSIRAGISGAAPLDSAVAQRAEARLGCLIRQGYGLTETSPGITQVADADAAATPADSVGRLLPNTEARLVDPATGRDAAPGAAGELWVRGPQVMTGYLDNPAATAETIVAGGWLRTGDLVRIDDDGLYWVVDRLKELIKYKGYQVAPAELEALLLTHPAVRDAAVVGIPHAEGGEAPKAFVVASGPLTSVELRDWVAERVAPYKKVRAVEFVDEIPKSPSGKILRRLLR
jgi:acyl-CoA synthetase (AMP-forming)/AMP-acid ligase II